MNRWACLSFFLLSLSALALEPVVTLHSTVTGSQAQPKVMYIVPWQQPGDARFDYGMKGSFADELFEPVDRDEFVRGLHYQAVLEGGADNDVDIELE
jgi:hypothetical protein